MMNRLLVLVLLCLSPAHVFAGEVMFEGFYKIKLENKPIGYQIQRFEFDPKTKTFTHTGFTRIKIGSRVVQESLKAEANDKLEPVKYQYTSQDGDQTKTIDAVIKGQNMTFTTTEGKKPPKTQISKMPKGTFFSSFLLYVMLKKKIAPQTAFQYSAIAEEDGNSYDGKALFESKEAKAGYVAFRVLNSFKAEKFYSTLALVPDGDKADMYTRGEALATLSPAKNIGFELLATPSQATEGELLPNKILMTLFGNMPTGKVNLLASPPKSGP